MKLFINDSDGKEDENNVNVISCILTSHIQQHNKINKIDDSDSQTMALRLMTAKILISIKFLCSKRDSSYCPTTRFRYCRKYSWSYPERGWRNLGFVICITHKRPLAGDGKCVTSQGHLTEKLMNKL